MTADATFLCPRREDDSPFKPVGENDLWRDGNRCSYCSSLHPALLLARIEAGTVELGPTVKDYKVYVNNAGGAPLPAIKFYFQHFSAEQQQTFIDALNAGKVSLSDPGYFPVLPFFCQEKDGDG